MSTSSSQLVSEKKHWWISNRKIINKYIRESRALISMQEPPNVASALGFLDAALAISPRHEGALELKARSLLFLRRFREVADMLQDYIPSYKAGGGRDDDSFTSLGSSDLSSRVELLSKEREGNDGGCSSRCFSVSELKRRVVDGFSRKCDREGHWRYLVLGKACFHLGLMEDAMVLLQTSRRLASAAFRRESNLLSDDDFSSSTASSTEISNPANPPNSASQSASESESACQLLSHIKLLLRRRAAASAALDAGLPSESIRHFSKLLDGRRGVPHPFASSALVGRSAAFRAASRVADAVADCNRALALDPSSIPALRARADLLESIGAVPDALRDLDYLKLLYDSILRDRKLPGPPWRPHNYVLYRDIPAELRALSSRIQVLRRRVAAGEVSHIDYHALLGVRRGCSRSELDRANVLLSLRHKPEKAAGFVDRLDFVEEHRDLDAVRDQARMSASILYRMIQKGYASIMVGVVEEEKQRAKETLAAAKQAVVKLPAVFQGVTCREMAVVGFGKGIPVKYEALSC
ncbi:uncharacterized protein [Typha latifolia]|uniref:uncharacterized protein isoform X1 n=1 Tax=Typha latifolia TaxID=4733 RepID=UPI003C2FE64C